MTRIILLALACLILVSPAQARHRQHVTSYAVDPMCNITMPCEGVSASVRGQRVARAMGGFGAPVQRYTPPARHVKRERGVLAVSHYKTPVPSIRQTRVAETIVEHPAGCPRTAFCGCGASIRVFGHSVRELWLAANWFKFPRSAPAPGTVAVRSHHVMVLEADLGGGVWRVYDANSGGHATRVHARSIAGYTIVSPRA